MKRRYHKIDGWRGYWIPANAIVGVSDTGGWDDSPCPTTNVKAEIARFQREVLRPAGIKSRTKTGYSTNVFCMKRWLTVSADDFSRAAELATRWLEDHRDDTDYIHDADLADLAESRDGTG